MGSNTQSPTTLTIIHFNDVYNIEPREQEPVGGAARFKTAFSSFRDLNPLVLFSGDVFNPSQMSAVTKGRQMVPVLNALGVHCAVYGNHDFDFGVDTLVHRVQETFFPWLMTNVIDNLTETPLAEGKNFHLMEWQGKQIGILGLVEEEWIATLATVNEEDITYLDVVEEGRFLAQALKQQGADFVIALTHMRWPNDTKLAENVPEIDLILGGHDHDYIIKQVKGKYIIKSGTDFRNFSVVTLNFDPSGPVDIKVKEVTVDSSFEEDEEIKEIVSKYMVVMGERMEIVLGEMDVEMDGRFSSIRTQETNLGNFITDIMLEATDADIALVNSGTLRSDTIHPKGPFKVKDLMSILPLVDPLVVLKVTGKQVLAALENAVSKYPALEGRFPQVSGVSFGFDPSKPPRQRVNPEYLRIQGEYMEEDRVYRLVTKEYLARGKDGYDVFKHCEWVVNEEDGPRLSTAVQNHFRSVAIVRGERKATYHHRQSILAANRRKTLVRQLSLPDYPLAASSASFSTSPPSSQGRRSSTSTSPRQKKAMLVRRASIESLETEVIDSALSPAVEGRIFIIDEEKLRKLEGQKMSETVMISAIPEADESLTSPPRTPTGNVSFEF